MSYPVSYRGGASSAAPVAAGVASGALAAAAMRAGFQSLAAAAAGGAAEAGVAGGAAIAGGLLAPELILGGALAVGIGIAGVELWRWYKGGRYVSPSSAFTLLTHCRDDTLETWGQGTLFCVSGQAYGGIPGSPPNVAPGVDVETYRKRVRPYPFSDVVLDTLDIYRNTSGAIAVAPTTNPTRAPPIWGAWLPGSVPGIRPVAGTRPAARPLNPAEEMPDWADGQPLPWNPAWELNPSGARRITLPAVRAVPKTGEPDTKLRMSRGLAGMVTMFNEFTEFEDFVEALFRALPKSCQSAAGGGKASLADQLGALGDCGKRINWNEAVFNIVWMNFTDEVWAKLGLPTKEAGLPYGANAPANIALGKAMGDQTAAGLKAWRAAAREGVRKVLGEHALTG